MTMSSSPNALLHIVVVGFHHKKGCQVEFSYPPLVQGSEDESGEVPLEWKHLPTLALPDGAHNYSKDTVYFHLKNRKGLRKATVYGVSCYRQVDAKDIVNKTDDITRGTVQKSVCVLTTLPCFGAIAAKLELVTHAWFEQKDFTQRDILRDAYDSLSASLNSLSVESQATMGLYLHDVVKLYRHKILVLFKLIMLERKTVFFMTPVSDLCNIILSILSLFPGLLELGLVESVDTTKTPIATPTVTEKPEVDDEVLSENTYDNEAAEDTPADPDTALSSHDQEIDNNTTNINSQTDSSSERTIVNDLVEGEIVDNEKLPGSGDSVSAMLPNMSSKVQTNELTTAGEGVKKRVQLKFTPGEIGPVTIPELDSADSLHQIDLEDQETSIWDDSRHHTLALTDDKSPEDAVLSSDDKEQTDGSSRRADRKALTIDISKVKTMEVVPVVSPTSITIDKAGLPLAIFTKGSVCHPYLSLSYYDILEDVNIRSFVIGASNVLFKQKKQNIDALVEKPSKIKKDDPGGIVILDKELQKQLQLTTEDLRFADLINSRVDDTVNSGQFLEGTEWEGGDEWIRAQFKGYLQSLMATVLAEDEHLLEAFNPQFVQAWKSTHNYKVWRNTVQQLQDVIPGHPCQGGVTLNDVKLQLARSERGRKINAAVDQAGKAVTDTTRAVGGALSNAKTMVSSWWSSLGNSSHQSDTST